MTGRRGQGPTVTKSVTGSYRVQPGCPQDAVSVSKAPSWSRDKQSIPAINRKGSGGASRFSEGQAIEIAFIDV